MNSTQLLGGARRTTLALVSAVLVSACVGEIGDPMEEGDLDDSGEVRRESSNRESSNSLFAQSVSANDMADVPFAANDVSKPLGRTAMGRELLTYQAKCMLGAGTTVWIPDENGVERAFKGLLGLAPAWTTRALTQNERFWLFGCLLAHINAFGKQIPISVRGPTIALKPSTTELTSYAFEEGAFWVTSPTGEWFACYGKATLDRCGRKLASDSIQWRVCSSVLGGVGCGKIHAVGPCRDFDGSKVAACETQLADGSYTQCHEYPSSGGVWPAMGHRIAQVVTTYVKQSTDIACDAKGATIGQKFVIPADQPPLVIDPPKLIIQP